MKLESNVEILSGFAFKSNLFNTDGLGIPLIRIRDVTSNSVSTYFNGEYKDDFIVENGDLLVGMDGQFNLIEWKGGKALLNQRVCKIIPDLNKIDKNYIKHLVPKALKEIEDKTSFVTVKHLTVKKIKDIELPKVSLETQKRIAQILDDAAALRDKTEQLLKEYDALAQSIFLDMFGDPVRNPKGWKTKTIEQLVKKEKNSIKRGPFGGALKKEIFVEDGYLVYEQYHALNNDFSMERYFIDENKFNELKGFEVNPGDIIISCSGVYLGKLAIIPKNAKKGIINQALLKVSIDENVMRNDFFIFLFSHKNFRQKYFDANRGAGIPNFPPMSEFKKFPFINPPFELQNQFAEKIALIEQQKELAKQELKESEDLFNCLLQKAFKGELV